jgi:SAM-dependent methyltransferase
VRSIATVKLALKVRRHSSANLRQAIAKVEALAGSAPVAQLRSRTETIYQREPTSAAKYARPHHWVLLNALRAADLGLHTSARLRILDIGCGPAFFLAIARALGHQCRGVDAPDSVLTPVERDVYTTLVDVLQCRDVVSPLLIERFKPLPFREAPFDLITAFWICFNRHRQPDEWGTPEWRFFVEDAMACLLPGGRMMLDLNENAERYGELRFYDASTRDYFRSVGTVDAGRVVVVRP